MNSNPFFPFFPSLLSYSPKETTLYSFSYSSWYVPLCLHTSFSYCYLFIIFRYYYILTWEASHVWLCHLHTKLFFLLPFSQYNHMNNFCLNQYLAVRLLWPCTILFTSEPRIVSLLLLFFWTRKINSLLDLHILECHSGQAFGPLLYSIYTYSLFIPSAYDSRIHIAILAFTWIPD